MAAIDKALRGRWQRRPEQTVRVIVRVKGDLSPAKARLSELGATVLRSFTLVNALAVSCSAKTALALLKEPWLQSLEEDRQLSVQQRSGGAKRG